MFQVGWNLQLDLYDPLGNWPFSHFFMVDLAENDPKLKGTNPIGDTPIFH